MSEYVFVLSSGEKIPVTITTRRGMRNITLRPQTRPIKAINISKPWLTSDSVALQFLEQKRRWCERIFASAPTHKSVCPNDTLVFLGRTVQLLHDDTCRTNRFVPGQDCCTLIIGGSPDMFEHRVRDYIKAEFLAELKKIIHSVPRDFWPRRIAIRDTSTRWGSCSTTGTMSFSWRLSFAPPEIMRYVVMHELAHTKHMNHSPEFWATVSQLYGPGVGRAKLWLSTHGPELHQYF